MGEFFQRSGLLNVPGEKADRSSGILLQFFFNLRIDIADSDTESVKLAVDEELKDSRPAINDFDSASSFSLRRSKSTVFISYIRTGSGSFALPRSAQSFSVTFSYSTSMTRWIMFRVSALAG